MTDLLNSLTPEAKLVLLAFVIIGVVFFVRGMK
jgi:hypothetical protein